MPSFIPAAAADGSIRVDAGGTGTPGPPPWDADTDTAPSPYSNAASSYAFSNGAPVTLDPSVPTGTPSSIFDSERWSPLGSPEMQWNVPVIAGQYEVRLYFADTYGPTQIPGGRVFDVAIEGNRKLDHYDIFADVGANRGVMKSFLVNSDSTLTIDFTHEVENPEVRGIEIVPAPANLARHVSVTPSSLSFPATAIGNTATRSVVVTNDGAAGDPVVTLSSTTVSGTDAGAFRSAFTTAPPVALAPGAATTVNVTFAPTAAGSRSATMSIAHDGLSSPLSVPLSGTTPDANSIGFGKSTLAGASSSGVTSLQFGPDGRLYASQFDGLIKVYTVARNAANSYFATATSTITAIQAIPNHNDDGTLAPTVNTRIVTGLLVAGTAASPVVYATSSDPRIGGGSAGTDTNLDTNSSMLSRLNWSGSAWTRTDLVRGLPRSEENHMSNGLALDPASNTIYIAQGGNTNAGAPSNNFAQLPEVALSAAVLSVNLGAIGDTTYDLPTLADSAVDGRDPFGGDNGKNQARLVPGGPVQVYAPGFRNPYDVLLASSGKLYAIDNGANAGWGAAPVGAGPSGTCTNAINEPGGTDQDGLHLITGPGYYAGHPNPTRANRSNTFGSPAQSPVSVANPIECDYRPSASANSTALTTFGGSADGLAEYTASNFGGQLRGNLLAAGYTDNNVSRIVLNAGGTAVTSNTPLLASIGSNPLDVTALGDAGTFPGTIWVGDQGNGAIYAFEPNDYGGATFTCSGASSTTLDEDRDGFTNADEIDNGTNPCSAADFPPDHNGNHISDLNDPDDDSDGLPDTSDPFVWDAKNGTTTTLPVRYNWKTGTAIPGPDGQSLLGLGFTGLMTDTRTNYASLFDAHKMTAGGAAGVMTVDAVPPGTALGTVNTQQYAFQFGVRPTTTPFTAHTRVESPFAGVTPQGNDAIGMQIGNGDQDNFLALTACAGGGGTGICLTKEVAGVTTTQPVATLALPGPEAVDLSLEVDPATASVQASYRTTTSGILGPRIAVGPRQSIPGSWLTSSTRGLAVGVLATSAGGVPFPATWDLIEVQAGVSGRIAASPSPLTEPATTVGSTSSATVTLTNQGGSGDPSIAINGVSVSGTDAAQFSAALTSPSPVTLPPGGTTTVSVKFAPTGAGARSATLSVAHSGTNSPVTVALSGTGLTPPPSSTTIAADPFTRTVSGGWGSAPTGGAWSVVSGPATDFSVNGSRALAVTPGSSTQRAVVLPTTSAQDVDASVKTVFPGRPVGSPYYAYLLLRRQSGGAYYRIGAVLRPDGTVALRGQTDTGASLFAETVTGTSFAAGGSVRVRVQVTGANPTTIRARAWADGTAEPTAWAVTATSSAAGLQNAGSVGLRSVNATITTAQIGFDDLSVLTSARSTGTWVSKAPSGFARQEVSYVNVSGKFYLAGGSTIQERYDPVANVWTNVAPLPANLDHIQGVAVGGLVYYIGGLVNWPSPEVSTLYIYDPVANAFRQGAPMPRGRGAGGVAVYNGKVYYAGGLNNGVAVPWFDAYDPATNTWQSLPDMPRPRDHFQAAVVGGRFFAIGGRNGAITATTTANDAFDLTTRNWSTGRRPLPTARGGFAAAVLGNEVVVMGGEGGGPYNGAFNVVEAYDTVNDSWRTLTPMPTARHGIEGAICNGGVYVAAGATAQGRAPTAVQDAFFLGAPTACTG